MTIFQRLAVVKVIVLHRWPHLDEILALRSIWRWLMKNRPDAINSNEKNRIEIVFWRYGNAPFPGAATQEEADENGILMIGCGRGEYDEHGKSGVLSAATLVLQAMGEADNAAMKPLLVATTANDFEGSGNGFALGGLIKALWKFCGDEGVAEMMKVIDFIIRTIDAVHLSSWNRVKGKAIPEDANLIKKLVARLRREAKPMVVQQIHGAHNESNRQAGGVMEPFSFVSIVKALAADKATEDEVFAWAHEVLKAKAIEDFNLGAATLELKKAKVVEVAVFGADRRFAAIVSDNLETLRAARRRDHRETEPRELADVIFIRNTRGRMVVGVRHASGLRLQESVVEAIIAAEAKKRGVSPAAVKKAGIWHLIAKQQILANGSNTAPDVPATLLTIAEIAAIVRKHLVVLQPKPAVDPVPAK